MSPNEPAHDYLDQDTRRRLNAASERGEEMLAALSLRQLLTIAARAQQRGNRDQTRVGVAQLRFAERVQRLADERVREA